MQRAERRGGRPGKAFENLLTDIELLRNALERGALARDRHSTLKTALATAAINKQTLHAWILELIAVDPELRKGLEIIVPAIVRESIAAAERSAAVDREGREFAEKKRKLEVERREAADRASELDRELRLEAERESAASRELAESVLRVSSERLAGVTEFPRDWLNAIEHADFSELETLFDKLQTITAPSGPAPG